MIECVPNFSEGRDPEVLKAIVEAIEARQVHLLDHGLDPDHNRAVVTFAGESDEVLAAAFEAVRVASERIDLTRHEGVHPRMGATDVCPFIPLAGSDMQQCVVLAHRLGTRVAEELSIPVYFYGEAALLPERQALPNVRRGGFEGLRSAIASERPPDRGPSRLHPTAGAVAVGARPFLVAFNVNLATSDLAVARAVARAVRESNGGLPGIRALGLAIEEGRTAQVSMNVCDYRRTSLSAVFDEVRRLARERGVEVRESELIGLAPSAALDSSIASHVRLPDFDPKRHVLEERLP